MKFQLREIIFLGIALSQFFLGYFFAQRQYEVKESQKSPIYLDIETNKSSIRIEKVSPEIFLRVDGVPFSSGFIELP